MPRLTLVMLGPTLLGGPPQRGRPGGARCVRDAVPRLGLCRRLPAARFRFALNFRGDSMKCARSTGVRQLRRLGRAGLFVALPALLASGCGGTYPQSTFLLYSDFARDIQGLFDQILFWAAVVFVVVEGILFWTILRYRRKPSDGVPPQIHGNTRLEVAWTAAPAIILLLIIAPTIQTIFKTQAPAPADALHIRVIAHQWWWEFQYTDPSLGVVTANEVHMPVGKTIAFEEQSADVIHSFWIPALGGKRDVVPGHTNHLWFTPDTVGEFPGQCVEFCGDSHANMRLRAFVQTQADFDAWVRQQKQPAATPPASSADAAKGAQTFQTRGCASCHTIAGTPAQAKVGPDLTHVGSRTTIAGGMLPNTPNELRAWLRNPTGVKPGALMPNLGLSNDELDGLVAYLQSLK